MREGAVAAAGLALAAAIAGPATAQSPARIYAQELADRVVVTNPGVTSVTIRMTPPKAKDEVVVVSGLASGPGGERVELELRDAVGENIGTLDLLLAREAGVDRAALQKRAAAIRDAVARRILNAGNLMDPYPFEAGAATRTHAQKLVDSAQSEHTDLLVLAMRAPPRGSRDMVVVGSTFGRHGKKADADDLKVLESPQPRTGVFANGRRFGADLPLRDITGKPVGTLNVGYAYRQGDDEKALLGKAERLRDELAARIPSAEWLADLDP